MRRHLKCIYKRNSRYHCDCTTNASKIRLGKECLLFSNIPRTLVTRVNWPSSCHCRHYVFINGSEGRRVKTNKMACTIFKWGLEERLFETVSLETSRSYSGGERRISPTGDMSADVFAQPQTRQLNSRYLYKLEIAFRIS